VLFHGGVVGRHFLAVVVLLGAAFVLDAPGALGLREERALRLYRVEVLNLLLGVLRASEKREPLLLVPLSARVVGVR
jgi:hypothetical protein